MRRKERFLSTRAQRLVGLAGMAGIATVGSGTTTVSVGAASVKSGSVVILTPQGYANTLTESLRSVQVGSVRTGGFAIVMTGSLAPSAAMNVGWLVISRP
jgi:hypothetical protein